jgi:hypothetical protein
MANIDGGRVARDRHAKPTTLAFCYSRHAAFSSAVTTRLPTDLLPLLLRRLFIKGRGAASFGIVLLIDKFIDLTATKL